MLNRIKGFKYSIIIVAVAFTLAMIGLIKWEGGQKIFEGSIIFFAGCSLFFMMRPVGLLFVSMAVPILMLWRDDLHWWNFHWNFNELGWLVVATWLLIFVCSVDDLAPLSPEGERLVEDFRKDFRNSYNYLEENDEEEILLKYPKEVRNHISKVIADVVLEKKIEKIKGQK